MIRSTFPYKTTTEAISVFDRANQYRPLLWDRAPNEIDWLNKEDNGLLLSLLDILPNPASRTFDQPYVNWTEDSRLDEGTQLAVAATATDTVLKLVDPYIVGVGNFLISTADGEAMRVVDVNYDLSQTGPTWQNSASIVGNIKVQRGIGGTARVAKSADSYVVGTVKYMAEQEDPKLGTGVLPGTKQFQYIGVAGETIKVTKRQQESEVLDNWGQLERAQIHAVLQFRRKLAKSLMFAPRFTEDRGADGQLYVPGGLSHFIKTNVLDLGGQSSLHTWSTFNEFYYNLFRDDASSQEKTQITGEKLYATLLKIARQMNAIDRDPYWEPTLATNAFSFLTDEGNRVNVLKDRFGLAANEGLADMAFVLDLAHISGGGLKGFPFMWVPNIQDNRSLQVREDAYWGSFTIIVKHEKTHGIIRGGTGRTVNQR